MHIRVEEFLNVRKAKFREIRHSDLPSVNGPIDVAKALNKPIEQISKTLFLRTSGYVLFVLPVSRRVDFHALSELLGSRPQMASPAELATTLAYPPMSVSPLACGEIPVLIDSSLIPHPTVLIGSGERGSEIELDVNTLLELSNARVVTASIAS
jgi:prolyl-tRNA editing enzyme YbaK/EbsC (Cys-tRNA(Pro) deacylase)